MIIKCILKSQPFIALSLMLGSNCLLGGYLVRVWERLGAVKNLEDMDSIINCVWYAFITMCTVGYGDYFAKSYMGRLVACTIALYGVFINSVLTVVLTETFNFKGGELKAYNLLNQIEYKQKLDDVTKKLFAKCAAIFVYTNKVKLSSDPKITRRLETFLNHLIVERTRLMRMIREVREEIKGAMQIEPIDLIIDKISEVKKAVNGMRGRINKFEEVMEFTAENQRNLEALKNTILSDVLD